jgi:hypothetical protein
LSRPSLKAPRSSRRFDQTLNSAKVVYVIEFQKRSLPRVHILVALDDDDNVTMVEAIDSCIAAELPDLDLDLDPILFQAHKTVEIALR